MDEVKLGLETACKELVARGYLLQSLASSIGIANTWNETEDLEKNSKRARKHYGAHC